MYARYVCTKKLSPFGPLLLLLLLWVVVVVVPRGCPLPGNDDGLLLLRIRLFLFYFDQTRKEKQGDMSGNNNNNNNSGSNDNANKAGTGIPQVLPLELIDKAVGQKCWIIMKTEKGMRYFV